MWYVGVGSLPYFSDDDEDSGDSSSQDDKSEGEESEDNDADFGGLMEDQLERRTSTSETRRFNLVATDRQYLGFSLNREELREP